jgi:alkylation response protein AidB-like acyl-CoA dehydrogenase
MTDYRPPLQAIDFVLNHVVDLTGLASYDAFTHADPVTVRGVLDEAGRFATEVLAPLNRVGDQQGAQLQPDGSVRTPDGWAKAYRRYVDAGWGGVAGDPGYGGGGFPWTVGLAIQELVGGANKAFALGLMLTQGAIDMLGEFAEERFKEQLLPQLVTAAWSGTMNLTEPQAGSDVGALTTRAIRQPDGTYRITGQKIFITYGEHDLTDNIVHLVLARVPDAPPGTKGISCFIVPKFLVGDDGTLGARNDVRCVSIEHKLGIHASPTCVMSYGDEGGAVGYLIGEENAGMRYMFRMMNNARLSVGLEGLTISERAYQQALAYAQDRHQGRAPGAPAGTSSPIIEHPDVRRMLLTMRAGIDAMRYLLYTNAEAVDRAEHDPDDATREAARELAELLTPISKAWCTDLGVTISSIALQVHGGMGYVEETGAAQHYRDARISPIYEGTNGIQAIDLVGRKLPMRGGGVVADHLARIAAIDADLAGLGDQHNGAFATIRRDLADGHDALATATAWLAEHGTADQSAALAGATPYLELFALVTGGWLHAKAALAAARLLAGGDADEDGFLAARIVSARFFCEQFVPRAAGLLPSVTAGARDLYALTPAQLGL